jgi:hypothetical protein
MNQSVDPSYDPAPYPPLGAISSLRCGNCDSGYVLQRDVPTCGMCGHMYRNGVWTREPVRNEVDLHMVLPPDTGRPANTTPRRTKSGKGRYDFDFICAVCGEPGKGVNNQKMHSICLKEYDRRKSLERAKRKAKARAEAKARQEAT